MQKMMRQIDLLKETVADAKSTFMPEDNQFMSEHNSLTMRGYVSAPETVAYKFGVWKAMSKLVQSDAS